MNKILSRLKELTIITNTLNIAIILSDYENFNVFMPGGILLRIIHIFFKI